MNVGGAGPDHFRSPDDVVISSKGDLYVADSGNGRIVRLHSAGAYVSEWGSKGTAQANSSCATAWPSIRAITSMSPTAATIASRFSTPKGSGWQVWSGFGNPYGLLMSGKELLVSEGEVHKIFHVDQNGKVVNSWGGPDVLQLPHFMAIDSQGVLYVAEVNGKRVQKFTLK